MIKYAKVAPPMEITTEAYVSNNADAETALLWSNVTEYSLGQEVRSDVTNRVYRSRINENTALNPVLDDGTNWRDVRPTNAWAMFDGVVGTQTVGTGTLTFTVQTTGWIDTIGMFNIEASGMSIVGHKGVDEVYNDTFNMVDNSGVTSVYSYFMAPFARKTEFAATGISLQSGIKYTVTLTGAPDERVAVGAALFGRSRNVGILLTNWKLLLADYSLKEFDEYGYYFLTRRASSDGGVFPMILPREETRAMYNMMKDLRGVPCVWMMEKNTVLFGFYRAIEPVHANMSYSEFDVVIEGLT